MHRSAKKVATPALVRQMAGLMGLDLDEDRAGALAQRFRELRESAAAMDGVDLGNIEPTGTLPLRQG